MSIKPSEIIENHEYFIIKYVGNYGLGYPPSNHTIKFKNKITENKVQENRKIKTTNH